MFTARARGMRTRENRTNCVVGRLENYNGNYSAEV